MITKNVTGKEALLASLPSPCEMEKSDVLDLLLREEYGYLPPAPDTVEVDVEERKSDRSFCAGKAFLKHLTFRCKGAFGEFSFPVRYACPKKATDPVPAFVHINFRPDVPDTYQPTEEIVDNGYAVLSFCYKDVTSDDGDFTNGLAGVIYPNGKREAHQCGKIGLWAWAAIRVLEYALQQPELDPSHICVVGHSRLGKTALLAGALDERFFCAFSNDSGCSGAAISREKEGEDIETICRVFPYWFCENYKKYAEKEDTLPFDQHYLLAVNYPHRVYVASAWEDRWAGPENEFLSCVAASDYFIKRGRKGFVHDGRLPVIGDKYHDGDIGYHLRDGLHYLSREDWNLYFEFLKQCEEMA